MGHKLHHSLTMKSRFIFIALLVSLLGGCASIKVERPNDPTGPQGLKVFPPKPYILLARAGEGGKIVSVSPLMLPDQTDPHFVRQTTGIGKANLTFTVENGILKQFGGDVDSKIPETLKEVGGLATSYGGLVKALAETAKIKAETGALQEEGLDVAKLKAAAGKFKSAAGSIQLVIDASSGLSPDMLSALRLWKDSLLSVVATLDNPNVDLDQAMLDELAKKVTTIATDFEKAAAAYPEVLRQNVATTSVPAEIRVGAKEIASKTPELPVFELYEVVQNGTTTTLVRVPIP